MVLRVVGPDDAVNLHNEQTVVSVARFAAKADAVEFGSLAETQKRLSLHGVLAAGATVVSHDVPEADRINAGLVCLRATVGPKHVGCRARGRDEACILVVLVTLLERLKDAVPNVRLRLLKIHHNHRLSKLSREAVKFNDQVDRAGGPTRASRSGSA